MLRPVLSLVNTADQCQCDGAQPCGRCTRTKEVCSYGPGYDGRRDKRRKLENDSALLNQLVDSIRAGEPLERLRSEIDAHLAVTVQYGHHPLPTTREFKIYNHFYNPTDWHRLRTPSTSLCSTVSIPSATSQPSVSCRACEWLAN